MSGIAGSDHSDKLLRVFHNVSSPMLFGVSFATRFGVLFPTLFGVVVPTFDPDLDPLLVPPSLITFGSRRGFIRGIEDPKAATCGLVLYAGIAYLRSLASYMCPRCLA